MHVPSRVSPALLAGLALALVAAPRASAAGEPSQTSGVKAREVSVAPLFDVNTRFKKKKAVKLRFRAQYKGAGAPLAPNDISFSLKDPKGTESPMPARLVKKGVFEVPFTPPGPGQYTVTVAIRGVREGAVRPIHLGVLGVADGLIELPEEKDKEFLRKRTRR